MSCISFTISPYRYALLDNEALPINPAPLPSSVDLSQGHHRFVFPSGDEYIGDWLDSQMHGQGTLYLNVSKDVTAPTVLVSFQGTFEKGIPIEGVAEYADGSSYEGPLSNGLSNGVGVYTKGGLSITGQFQEGVPVGMCDVIYFLYLLFASYDHLILFHPHLFPMLLQSLILLVARCHPSSLCHIFSI